MSTHARIGNEPPASGKPVASGTLVEKQEETLAPCLTRAAAAARGGWN